MNVPKEAKTWLVAEVTKTKRDFQGEADCKNYVEDFIDDACTEFGLDGTDGAVFNALHDAAIDAIEFVYRRNP